MFENETYYYVVRAVDTAFNRSANSDQVTATAELRTVTLTFNRDRACHNRWHRALGLHCRLP
jgi:hypothetical protein